MVQPEVIDYAFYLPNIVANPYNADRWTDNITGTSDISTQSPSVPRIPEQGCKIQLARKKGKGRQKETIVVLMVVSTIRTRFSLGNCSAEPQVFAILNAQECRSMEPVETEHREASLGGLRTVPPSALGRRYSSRSRVTNRTSVF